MNSIDQRRKEAEEIIEEQKSVKKDWTILAPSKSGGLKPVDKIYGTSLQARDRAQEASEIRFNWEVEKEVEDQLYEIEQY